MDSDDRGYQESGGAAGGRGNKQQQGKRGAGTASSSRRNAAGSAPAAVSAPVRDADLDNKYSDGIPIDHPNAVLLRLSADDEDDGSQPGLSRGESEEGKSAESSATSPVSASASASASGTAKSQHLAASGIRRVDVVPVWQEHPLRVGVYHKPPSEQLRLGGGHGAGQGHSIHGAGDDDDLYGGAAPGSDPVGQAAPPLSWTAAAVRSLREADRAGRVLSGDLADKVRKICEPLKLDGDDVLECWHVPRNEVHLLLRAGGEHDGIRAGGDGQQPPTPSATLAETARVEMKRFDSDKDKDRRHVHERLLRASRAGFMVVRWVRAVPRRNEAERWHRRCCCGLGWLAAMMGCIPAGAGGEMRGQSSGFTVVSRRPAVRDQTAAAVHGEDDATLPPQHGLLKRSEVIDCMLLEVHPPRVALGRHGNEAVRRSDSEREQAVRDLEAEGRAKVWGGAGWRRQLVVLPEDVRRALGEPSVAKRGQVLPALHGSECRPLVVPWRSRVFVGARTRAARRPDDLRRDAVALEPAWGGRGGGGSSGGSSHLEELPLLPGADSNARTDADRAARRAIADAAAAALQPAGERSYALLEEGGGFMSIGRGLRQRQEPWFRPPLPGAYHVRYTLHEGRLDRFGETVSKQDRQFLKRHYRLENTDGVLQGWKDAHGTLIRPVLATGPRLSLEGPLHALPGAARGGSLEDQPPPQLAHHHGATKLAAGLAAASADPTQPEPVSRHWAGAPIRVWFSTSVPEATPAAAGPAGGAGASLPPADADRVVLVRLRGSHF